MPFPPNKHHNFSTGLVFVLWFFRSQFCLSSVMTLWRCVNLVNPFLRKEISYKKKNLRVCEHQRWEKQINGCVTLSYPTNSHFSEYMSNKNLIITYLPYCVTFNSLLSPCSSFNHGYEHDIALILCHILIIYHSCNLATQIM